MSQLQQFYKSPETNKTYIIAVGQTTPVDAQGAAVQHFR